MIRKQKHILVLILTTICLCGSQNLFGIFDLPLFYKWKKEMLGKIQSTFESLFPEDERRNWKSLDGEPDIGDINKDAFESWISVNQSPERWSEQVSIGFVCKPNKDQKRQYSTIDEAFEVQKKNYKKENAKWVFNKINNKEALIELDLGEGKNKKIQRKIMVGDWLIGLTYQYKPTSEEDKKLWEQKRDLWIKRFMNIKFD